MIKLEMTLYDYYHCLGTPTAGVLGTRFSSDSRLTGGGNIDVCQKIFPLPREDGAIGFCGSTLIAYPIIHQVMSYIRHYKANLDRALDGSELPNRIAALANNFLLSYIDAQDLEVELKETAFIVGCFSVKLRGPIIKCIRYDKGYGGFVAANTSFPRKTNPKLSRSAKFAMIGDLRAHYISELMGLTNSSTERFDMEPFSALCAMLGNEKYIDRRTELRGPIGGAPQILKVYPFYRTVEFGVQWPSQREGHLYFNGRKLFDYEKVTLPQIDCESLHIYKPLADL